MSSCLGFSLSEAWLAPDFCVDAMPLSIGRARGVLAVGTSDVLALERTQQAVVHLQDTDGDGLADTKKYLAFAPGINHGLAIYEGYLYASSDTTVFRWELTATGFDTVSNGPQVVIDNMSPGGHTTRTLAFDAQGRIYVSIGSDKNIDTDSFRSRIRRFVLPPESSFPVDFETGEVFADGLRNEVGLAFDKFGVLWGVENAADRLFRGDLGGDIHNENPGEELNRFREEDSGKHWGYPFCWSEFFMEPPTGQGAGAVWAWPSTMNSVTDADCRADYEPSVLSMQAHSAPLGMTFYEYKEEKPEGCSGGFPKTMDGYIFIAFHGSWNRDIPTGYKVVYVAMDADGNMPPGTTAQDLLKHEGPNAAWTDGFRPVDVDFDECGRLVVSSDGTGGRGSKMVRIGSTLADPAPVPATPAPVVATTPSPVSPAPVTPAPITPSPVSPAPVTPATPAPSSAASSGGSCFSGEMTLEMEDKSIVPLKNVKIGDRVKVDTTGEFEAIYGFGHHDKSLKGDYLQIRLSDGNKLELSAEHMVFVNHQSAAVPASVLSVGSELVSGDGGGCTIESIKTVKRVGAYAPFTYSGTIVVNGIKASTYISLQHKASMLTVGDVETPISHQWLAQSMLLPLRVLGSNDILTACNLEWMRDMGMELLNEQHAAVLAMVMIPLVGFMGAMWLFEFLWLQPGMAIAVGLGVYFIAAMRRSSFAKAKAMR